MSLKNLKIFLMAVTAFVAFSTAYADDDTLELLRKRQATRSEKSAEILQSESADVNSMAASGVACKIPVNDVVNEAVREEIDNPKDVVTQTITVTKVYTDSTTTSRTFTNLEDAERWAATNLEEVTKAADMKSKRTKMSSFMIGAELGTGLDLSGTDLSTFNFDVLLGYRSKAIQFLGIGAGVHKSLGTRDSFIPLQVVFRTGFIPRPTLAFMQVSAGYSFNTIASSPMFGDVTATVGGGINLVQRPKFQSYITLSFGFRHISERHQALAQLSKPNVGFVQIALGVSM